MLKNIITDRILDLVFLRFRGFSSTITPRQKPKGVTRMWRLIIRQRESMRFRFVMNEEQLNLEKTTFSVLFVIVN